MPPLPSRWWWLGLLILWGGVIFTFSHQPGSGLDWEPPLWYVVERKSAHIFEYAVFMFLATGFFRACYPRQGLGRVLVLAFVTAITYGCMDEVHQFFIFGRSAKVMDVFFDALGAGLMGAFIWLFLSNRFRHHSV